MTQQAINSIELYKGNNPGTIEKALKFQKSSVVEELKEHFKYKHSYEYKKIYRSRLTTIINKSFNKYNDDGSKVEE